MHCRAGDITHPGTGNRKREGRNARTRLSHHWGEPGWRGAGQGHPPMTGQLVLHGPAGVGGDSLAVAVAGESYCSARWMSRSGS